MSKLIFNTLIIVLLCSCNKTANGTYDFAIYSKNTTCRTTYSSNSESTDCFVHTGHIFRQVQFTGKPYEGEFYVTVERLEGKDTIKIFVSTGPSATVRYNNQMYGTCSLLEYESQNVNLPYDSLYKELSEIEYLLPHEDKKTIQAQPVYTGC